MSINDEEDDNSPERKADFDVYGRIADLLRARSKAAGRTLTWGEISDEVGPEIAEYRNERLWFWTKQAKP